MWALSSGRLLVQQMRALPALRRPAHRGVRRAEQIDHVVPPVPLHQRGLSAPSWLRWYWALELEAVSAVLHIFLRVMEAIYGKRPGSLCIGVARNGKLCAPVRLLVSSL